MSSWPSPQKTSQWKEKLPALSGVKLTRVSWPGTISVRRPKSGILKPWIAVFRGQHQNQRLAELGRNLVWVILELLGADVDLDRALGGKARDPPPTALADQQRDEKLCDAWGSAFGDRQLDQAELSPPHATSRVPRPGMAAS